MRGERVTTADVGLSQEEVEAYVQSVVEHIGAPLREDGCAVASLLVPDDALFKSTLRDFVEKTVPFRPSTCIYTCARRKS